MALPVTQAEVFSRSTPLRGNQIVLRTTGPKASSYTRPTVASWRRTSYAMSSVSSPSTCPSLCIDRAIKKIHHDYLCSRGEFALDELEKTSQKWTNILPRWWSSRAAKDQNRVAFRLIRVSLDEYFFYSAISEMFPFCRSFLRRLE